MKLNISNPIEAIYLNIFTYSQNIELQIMITCVHLSKYHYLLLTFPFSNCLMQKVQMQKAQASIKHTDLKSQDKEIYFSL